MCAGPGSLPLPARIRSPEPPPPGRAILNGLPPTGSVPVRRDSTRGNIPRPLRGYYAPAGSVTDPV